MVGTGAEVVVVAVETSEEDADWLEAVLLAEEA